jgi:hypothetical protein
MAQAAVTRVCICGGGSLAHALAAAIGARADVELRVLTRQPDRWSRQVRGIYLDVAEIVGNLAAVSADPAIVADAEFVLIALPAPAIEEVLRRIEPFVRPASWVVGIPGYGGFDWMARSILGPDVPLCGFQRVPYVRKTISYGEAVWISGIRPRLFVATLPSARCAEAASAVSDLLGIPASPLPNYLAVNLSASNPTFHPARIHTAFRELEPGIGPRDRGLFYEDWDDAASDAFLALDKERAAIASAYPLDGSGVVPILQHYGAADAGDLTGKIRRIRALRDRHLPLVRSATGWVPDVHSSYFVEDIGYGLYPIRALAEIVDIRVPTTDAILDWAGRLMHETMVDRDGRFAVHPRFPSPQRFGLTTPARVSVAALEP